MKAQLILNTNGNLDQFQEFFKLLDKKGVGKLRDKHFTVSTDIRVKPLNELYEEFTKLQDDAFEKGYENNIYCLNINA